MSVAALVITGFAIRFPGLSSSQVDVSDGGVWVTNDAEGLIGRINVDAEEVDGRIGVVGDDLDILQSGYTLLQTHARGFTVVDTAMATPGAVVDIPAGGEVALGGDRVAITAGDGRVWILSPDEAGAFSPSAFEPVHTADDSAPPVAVSKEGTVFVLDGSELLTFERTDDTRDTEAGDPADLGGNVSGSSEQLELTAVGEEPVVLDRENRLLRLGTSLTDYDLTAYGVSSLETAELQQPGSEADTVTLATEDSLFVIPLGGGSPAISSAGGTGEPVPPVQAKGCAYGAWNKSERYVRTCGADETPGEPLDDSGSGAELALRENSDLVVLNDQRIGMSWMISDSMRLVDDWVITKPMETETTEEEEETVTSTVTNVVVDRDEENQPPVANDDSFGVRAGENVVLPVTRNDTDPDGDLLTVSVDGSQPGIGTVTPVRGGTDLQIAVEEDASGTSSFTYLADDGRGGTDTATVDLEVVPDAENSAPRPFEDDRAKLEVRSSESTTINMLPYWEDPDGDAFYLADATVAPDDLVTFEADGQVTFHDAGLTTGTKTVELTFRDEHGASATGELEVEVVADDDLAPITTADHVSVVAGRTATIKPLLNDLNPNGGNLELTHVTDSEGLEIETALDAGTVTVMAEEPKTHYLEYTVVAEGASASATGLIRVDVVDPESEELVPVPVDDMGTVVVGSETLVDPLENDVDPSGGVLVVNSATAPEGSGLKTTVLAHHLVKVEAEPGTVPSDEPVPVTYEVANAAGSSTGTIRVMVANNESQLANPVTVPDTAVVRAGDQVIADVLDNDTSPSGSQLSIRSVELDDGSSALGHAEPRLDQVRFIANADATGEATVTYEVEDDTGRTETGRLTVEIIPASDENRPPKPEHLTARTLSGSPVRIPVPTSGIDPDGDSVVLTGIASPTPMLGEVTEATGEWIEYTPHRGEVGTDRFRYQVMDRHGAVGTGEVVVGVAAPHELNQPPYAEDDTVEVRPDRLLQIDVLENDTDPEGAPLSIVREDVEAVTDIEVLGDDAQTHSTIAVRAPEEEGTHTILYSASDGQLSSPATVTVTVDEDAPPRAPIARDDYVEASAVLDPENEHIDVDVLANDSDPDGSTQDLVVSLDDPPEGTELLDNGSVRVTPQDEQQQIRYEVEDLDGLTAAGYIWVPGTAQQEPVWVGGTLEVISGAELAIDLTDPELVRVRPGGQPVQVTGTSAASAQNSDGSNLISEESTLVYRSAEGHSGDDVITVEVTDGEPGDATAATATLAIPIRVAPEDDNEPPTFQGVSLEAEQGGGQATVDLASSVDDPDGDDLVFELGDHSASDEGIDVGLSDSTFTAQATSTALKDTRVEVPVTVSDGVNDPVPATVEVVVGGSSRPLISAGLDEATIDAGTTDTIDVLANDSNPFPGGDRTLVSASLERSDAGEISVDGDQVTVSPDEDFHGVLLANYVVADDTEDPDRHVTGNIRVNVRGKPSPPSVPRVVSVGDSEVELSFTPGDENGAPITGYRVTSSGSHVVTRDCSSATCTVTGLQNDTVYRFEVTAINDVGESDPSRLSAEARPDVKPEQPSAPSAERGDEELAVSWQPPVNRGSAMQRYDLRIQNTETGDMETRELDASTTSLTWGGLTNGTDYRFQVRAHNLADDPSDWSEWSRPEHPAGRPGQPSGKITAERVNTPLGGRVELTFPAMTDAEANGEPIEEYIITASSGKEWTIDASSGTNSFEADGLDKDSEHTFTYTGVNSVGKGTSSSGRSNAVTPWAEPKAPTGVSASLPNEGEGNGPNGRAVVSWEHADDRGTSVEEYVVRWNGGSKTVPASESSTTVSDLTNGTSYRFTVQARNGFAGGESEISSESAAVTPYTKPAGPKASSSTDPCSNRTTCPVSVTVEANGADGGRDKTLQYRVGTSGDFQNASGTSHTVERDLDSGESLTVQTRVRNEGGLVSGTVTEDVTARTFSDPKLDGDIRWGDPVPAGTGNCRGDACKYFEFTLKDLAPGEDYEITLSNEPEPDYKTFTVTAGPDGRATTGDEPNYYGYILGGSPSHPMTIKVDGKVVADGIYTPYP